MKALLKEASPPLTVTALLLLLLQMIPAVGQIGYAPPLVLGAVLLYACRDRLPRGQWLLLGVLWVACAVLIYRCSPVLSRWLAGKTAGHPVLFAAVNTVYETLLTPDYADLFYHKAYARSILTQQGIVSGAADIFAVQSSDVISQYLTGKYVVTLFLPFGLLPLKADQRLLLSLTALSVLAGDSRLLSAYLLLTAPAVFVCYVAVGALGYFAVSLLDIRIGFTHSAALSECVRHLQQPVFFLLVGAVCAVMLLFVTLYTQGKIKVMSYEL